MYGETHASYIGSAPPPPPKAQPGCSFFGVPFLSSLQSVTSWLNVAHAASAAKRRRERRLRAMLRHERRSVAMALAEFTHHSSRGGERPTAGGVARRRRERRLRSWWRHKQLSVAIALFAAAHHSSQQNAASRGPKTCARAREVEEQVTDVGLRVQKTPPPGERQRILPAPLPQRSDRSRRHFSGDGLPQLALPLACAAGEPWTLQPSPSSSLSRWRRRSTRSRRRERRRRRRPSRRGKCAARGSRTSSWPFSTLPR